MVSNPDSGSSQSVSDSAGHKQQEQEQQQEHQQTADHPEQAVDPAGDVGNSFRSPEDQSREVTLVSKKRSRTPSVSSPSDHDHTAEARKEEDGPPSESFPPATIAIDHPLDMNVAADDPGEQTWFSASSDQHRKPPPAPYRSSAIDAPADSSMASRQVLIRPTSIPHDKSLFLRTPEAARLLSGFAKADTNVTTVDGSFKLSREQNAAADLGSGRKSFVEWRPMVTSSTDRADQFPPWSSQGPDASGVVSSHGFPAATGVERTGNEDRQFLFLGPSDADRPLGSGARQQEAIAVVMEGRSIAGSICLREYDGYGSFATALRSMFSRKCSSSNNGCDLSNAVPGHIVAYEDEEGDLLLAGDLSWRKFVRSAKRIRILSAKGRSVVAVP